MPKIHEEATGKTICKIRKKTCSEMAQICTYVYHTQMTVSADTRRRDASEMIQLCTMRGLVDVGIVGEARFPAVNPCCMVV